jgi:AAA15 family ATPase/GTPase
MLTKITIRNFKRFGEVEIDLGSPVVFIGPNNSGKTTALQALAFWSVGLKRWLEKRKNKSKPEKRPGVTINRLDLVAVPVPNSRLFWKELHVRNTFKNEEDKLETQNILIEIVVEGFDNDRTWQCGLEFDFANEESLYCRPLRTSKGRNPERMPVPDAAEKVNIAFLPPMSGLALYETRLDDGAIAARIGEGRTSEVIRNLCYKIYQQNDSRWDELKAKMVSLFSVAINNPVYVGARGEITLTYSENKSRLDLSASGRGLQQTLLLLTYMYANPGSALLLDEPDAHLEILRQREMYRFLVDTARENGNQIIAASHSEVLLEEAAEKDMVVAFLGKPHRLDDRGSQLQKALREIGFRHYYQAEQTGWVLYLEGSTDLAILQTFAHALQYHDAVKALERPYVHYVGNSPMKALDHFYGLREAVPRLKAVSVFDRLEKEPPRNPDMKFLVWQKREIENYLCMPEVLDGFAAQPGEDPGIMKAVTADVEKAMGVLGKGSPWSADTKVSDDFFFPLFKSYYEKRNLPNIMTKTNFHQLARFAPRDKIDPEVKEKLDAIVEAAASATPL